MKLLCLTLSLLVCACTSLKQKNTVQIDNQNYSVISNQQVISNQDKVDAVIYWHQRTDDAIIRTTHKNERKEGKFFIPNLATGLSKLIKKRNKVIIMVLDEDMMQHSRTKTILKSLPKATKVYISYFPKNGTQK